MATVEEKIKKIICEQLDVAEKDVVPEASFVDDLGADSLDTVELVMALEEEFECEIPDEEAEKITTVQQAIRSLQAADRSASTARRRRQRSVQPRQSVSVGRASMQAPSSVITPEARPWS